MHKTVLYITKTSGARNLEYHMFLLMYIFTGRKYSWIHNLVSSSKLDLICFIKMLFFEFFHNLNVK